MSDKIDHIEIGETVNLTDIDEYAKIECSYCGEKISRHEEKAKRIAWYEKHLNSCEPPFLLEKQFDEQSAEALNRIATALESIVELMFIRGEGV